MTKEEIIQYVLQSPENTNPNVLKGMLDELDTGPQAGYKVTIINNSELTINIDAENTIKENAVCRQAYVVEPNSTSSKIFIDVSQKTIFTNYISLSNESDFNIICSSNDWESEYDDNNRAWYLYYNQEVANTKDITITITTEPNIIFQDIVWEYKSGVYKTISPAIVTFEESESYTFFISFDGENYKKYNLTAAINNGILYWGPTSNTSFTNPMPRIEYNPETNVNNFTAIPKGSATPTGTFTMYVATWAPTQQ